MSRYGFPAVGPGEGQGGEIVERVRGAHSPRLLVHAERADSYSVAEVRAGQPGVRVSNLHRDHVHVLEMVPDIGPGAHRHGQARGAQGPDVHGVDQRHAPGGCLGVHLSGDGLGGVPTPVGVVRADAQGFPAGGAQRTHHDPSSGAVQRARVLVHHAGHVRKRPGSHRGGELHDDGNVPHAGVGTGGVCEVRRAALFLTKRGVHALGGYIFHHPFQRVLPGVAVLRV